MVYFSKLKLYGFKSFVDKTELEIGPGLNGIVGPNGCGKSNLVEALRWVMGEKSAKNMRGGGMEDVIFAGTSKRPARSIAEVTVVMNNEDGTAPAPFNSATEIEINRKIEKDKGSQYRVNGKAVRARDVNLLFADTMTGANSPALVSQGRISEIIIAKPSDRRKVLEESAGISGLHSRRHEAELRLRAAEQNLTRLDDSLGDIRSRLSSLKRQARQAERYKELSDQIRRLDMAITWSEWSETRTKIKQDRAEFDTHNTQVQSALQVSKSVTTQIEDLETELPDLRKNHMEAQAVLQNLRVSLDRLEQDIQTKTKGLQDALESKNQIETDSAFTQEQFDSTTLSIGTTQQQLDETNDSGKTLPDDIEQAEQQLSSIQETLDQLRSNKHGLETKIAVANQSKANLETQYQSANATLSKINSNIAVLIEAIEETNSKIETIQSDEIFSKETSNFEKNIKDLKDKIESLSEKQTSYQQNAQELKTYRDETQSSLSAMEGELNGLKTLVENSLSNDDMPQGDDALINHLNVTEGYEKAISTALGQWATMAGLDENASVYWSSSNITIDTPTGCEPLINFVKAPTALKPLLTAIGVTETLPFSNNLSAGQMIVTHDGDVMRWDGLIAKSSATQSVDQAHVILEQKNRILDLEKQVTETKEHLTKTNIDLETIETKREDIKIQLDDARTSLSTIEKEQTEHRYALERLNDQLSSLTEKRDDQNTRLNQNKTEQEDAAKQVQSLQNQINDSDDSILDGYRAEIETITEQVDIKNTDLNTVRESLNTLRQALSTRTQTISRLENDLARLTSEKEKLNARLADFTQRAETIDAKILAYRAEDNGNSEDIREELLSKIETQDKSLSTIASQLDEKDSLYKRLQSELREADSKAAAARENRARAQANVANGEESLNHLQNDIAERFSLSPQALEEQTFSLFDDNIPTLDNLHNDKETVTRQRDAIGPVNLRAAIESQETEQHLAEMEIEYTDLTKAIEQLRGGIAKLNKEAKERLAIAFQRVDTHFQRLFTQLFEGGKAYLQMIESEDPLESGLEIFAQPPGKALQKLSLLSGGEQTLTATALIFAMFLTNPSPICVLDEIDAPLDDANVDRICSLMETIVKDTDTRFIVITHHRMTMARMDRLYGVTMAERGVSQLVSVDMALQEEMELSESA